MCRLKNPTLCLPGDYRYTQTEGLTHKFEPTVSIKDQAAKVRDFRVGNKLPRATYNEAIEDIDRFNCQRFHCDKRWCFDDDQIGHSTPYESPVTKKPCAGCGAKIWSKR
jgi:hypothetical protein